MIEMQTVETSIKFNVPGKPQGKERHRTAWQGGKAHSYTPKATVDYEKRVRHKFTYAVDDSWPLDWTYWLDITAYVEIPESYPKWRKELIYAGKIFPTVKPDHDNYSKIVSDALNGVAWLDDARVVDAHQKKRYCMEGEAPRMSISIIAKRDPEDRWTEEYKLEQQRKEVSR